MHKKILREDKKDSSEKLYQKQMLFKGIVMWYSLNCNYYSTQKKKEKNKILKKNKSGYMMSFSDSFCIFTCLKYTMDFKPGNHTVTIEIL